MRVYRKSYKYKGKRKPLTNYRIDLIWKDRVVRFPGHPDKESSRQLGKDIERLMALRKRRLPIDDIAEVFIRDLDKLPRIKQKLVDIGVLDKVHAATSKPLAEHVKEFRKSLSKTTDKHVKIVTRRVERIIKECGFVTWSAIDPYKIDQFIEELLKEGLEKQTASFYVKAFRQFCHWMVNTGRATNIPKIQSIKVPRKFERAFEFDEFDKLLSTAQSGPIRFGMTGDERYLVYRIAVETGLRRRELNSITPNSIDFKNFKILVKGENTKNGDDAEQNISPETAALLKEHIKGKKPDVKLFNIPDKSAKMIQADCQAAGIKVENNRGKLKFHSLRHTCGTFLADKGLHPKIIQDIMRHADINLTMSRYTHTLRGRKAAAVAGLLSKKVLTINKKIG